MPGLMSLSTHMEKTMTIYAFTQISPRSFDLAARCHVENFGLELWQAQRATDQFLTQLGMSRKVIEWLRAKPSAGGYDLPAEFFQRIYSANVDDLLFELFEMALDDFPWAIPNAAMAQGKTAKEYAESLAIERMGAEAFAVYTGDL